MYKGRHGDAGGRFLTGLSPYLVLDWEPISTPHTSLGPARLEESGIATCF